MSTSASTLANRQNSYFTLWANHSSTQEKKPLAINLSGNNSAVIAEEENPFSRVLQFFGNTEIVGNVIHDVVPAGNLYYKDSLILKFSLSDKYARYFPLLRGFFGFGKLTGLTVLSNIEDKTFQIVLYSVQSENVLRYIEHLFLELKREINFKVALKDVLVAQQEATRIQKISFRNFEKSFQQF
jgi:hypothetical protein